MIKEALQYIIDLKKPDVIEVDGRNYHLKQMSPVKHPQPSALEVSSLQSVLDYIRSNIDAVVFPIFIHVGSPIEVKVLSPLYGPFEQRNCYLKAEARIPDFSFGRFMDSESFIIAMQSKFIRNEHSAVILSLVGNITDSNVRTYGDDGVSQTVQAKTGIAKVGEVAVPNPVILKPYRTFVEVDQPESMFVFRMKKGHESPEMALFEADGGAWKNVAMMNIRNYFEANLSEEIAEKKVILIS